MLNKNMLLIGALALIGSLGVRCSEIQAEREKLDALIGQLDEQFVEISKSFFWDKKAIADQLEASGNIKQAGALMSMAQVSTFIESIKYAIRRKSLLVAKEIITERFVESDNGLVDTRGGVVMLKELIPAIVARANLRGYVDVARFSDFMWKWLHKLIEHYAQNESENPHWRSVAVDSYKRLLNFRHEFQQALDYHKATISKALQQMGIEHSLAVNIVAAIDFIINDTVQCKNCLAGDEIFGVRQRMFDNDESVKQLIGEQVDPKLSNAYRNYPGVYDVDYEQRSRVTEDEINALMATIMS